MKKRIWTVDLTILTLGVACAVLAGMLAAVKPMLLLVVVPVLAVMGLLLFWNVRRNLPLPAWHCRWWWCRAAALCGITMPFRRTCWAEAMHALCLRAG